MSFEIYYSKKVNLSVGDFKSISYLLTRSLTKD